MQKWEYLTVGAKHGGIEFVDTKEVRGKDAKGKPVILLWVDYAKELGEQGWELAGVLRDEEPAWRAFFKRPIE